MSKAVYFLLGFVVASWASCAVCYFVGRSVIEEYRALHQKAIDFYSKLHADAVATYTRIEQRASAVVSAIEGK